MLVRSWSFESNRAVEDAALVINAGRVLNKSLDNRHYRALEGRHTDIPRTIHAALLANTPNISLGFSNAGQLFFIY